MAENSSLHHIHTNNYSEEEVEQEDPTDSFSPSNPTFFIPSVDDFDSRPESVDLESGRSDLIANSSSFLYGSEDQVDLVTDLFNTRNDDVMDHPHVYGNSDARVLPNGEEVEFGSEFDGLQVVGLDSVSDSEDMEVISGVIHHTGGDSSVRNLQSFSWIDDEGDSDEDFEWEEVERVEGRGDNMSHLYGIMEEISVSSDFSSEGGNLDLSEDGEEDHMLNFEWLVAVNNNLERNLQFHNAGIIQDDGVFDTVHFVGNEEGLNVSPPAAKSVLENLPLVAVSDEDLKGSNVPCAICQDEIMLTEKVTRLPCSHYYHYDCVMPWLNIRNTCPVCRYELPTDDADYERKNGRSAGPMLVNDFQVLPRGGE